MAPVRGHGEVPSKILVPLVPRFRLDLLQGPAVSGKRSQ